MEMEKKRSKGSFLSLFDWNSKSRKKLTWNNPTLPEVSKQGKENVENLPKSRLNRIKVDETGAIPSNNGSCDFDSTPSIGSDEGCGGSKAPGLVARLMGLDSLPASATNELSFNSLYGSNSRVGTHGNVGDLHSLDNFHSIDYINTPLKMGKSSLDAVESRGWKVENLPIRRFQSEVLPPKSAKPIPVTHNKLLSPIKSPCFLSPKNAAHVMEAAAKIMESSPRPYMRNRIASTGSSSVPSRILDLKERLEAAQYASTSVKPVDLGNAYPTNGKLGERCSNLYKCPSAFKVSRDSEKSSSCHLASNKGKSVPLAIQAKTNSQSRDTLVSNGNRKSMKPKEKNEINSNQLLGSQKPSAHRAMQQRTGASRNSNVLRQNNQKQNGVTTKGKSTSKIDPSRPTTQALSSESSTRTRKTTNKSAINANIQPKRSSTRATDNQKEFPQSKTSLSQKKRYIGRDVHVARGPDHTVNSFESKSIKCNFTTDGSSDQDAFNMKEGKDVISFTFTSPLRRNMPESVSSTEKVVGARKRIDVNSLGSSENLSPKKLPSPPPGLHMIDGDALSVLLEKKLLELTSRINLPECTLATEGSSTSSRCSLQDKVSTVTMPKEHDKFFYPDLVSNKLDSMHIYHCSSDDPELNMNQQLQASEVGEDPSCSSNSESVSDVVCRHSTAVTGCETSFASESYLDSEDSAYGSTVYSSMQDEEVSNFSQINESVLLEDELKWSEQSSSTLAGENMAIEQINGISNLVDHKRSSDMELEYVQHILGNTQFLEEDFIMGQTNSLIMPNLFDLLENQNNGTENCGEEYSKLERKVIFDYVSESLELRCKRAFVGTCKVWLSWVTSVERKNWMAEELCKEMLNFRSMEEVMVDELVDKDMSTGCGKWLDFEVEAFEEGLEVEEDILGHLINELVSDFLLV